MALNAVQIATLDEAIGGYAFPAVYYNYAARRPVAAATMGAVEHAIGAMLRAPRADHVCYGLQNVIYWGWAQRPGIRSYRLRRFGCRIAAAQLARFQVLVRGNRVPDLMQLGALGIPEFSGVSFVSKILMFLRPVDYCVLDRQLARMSPGAPAHKALARLVVRGTQIPISGANQIVYDGWRAECKQIGGTYFGGRYRAVDVERGFFALIQSGRLPEARAIYAAA